MSRTVAIFIGVLSCALMVSVTAGCRRTISRGSPSGRWEAEASSTSQGLIHLQIRDTHGNAIHREDTRIAFGQGFSLEWRSDAVLLLRSSDSGPTEWQRTEQGTWARRNPLHIKNPHNGLVLGVHWANYRSRTLVVSLLKELGTSTFSIEAERETGVVVDDLVGCVQWLSEDTFSILGRSGLSKWRVVNGEIAPARAD